jgi:hypothetical protein
VVHPDAAAFRATVEGLLTNLLRYPEDADDVVAALSGLGKSHPSMSELLVEHLFHIDRRFVLQERSLSDVAYLATLVLFFSSGFVVFLCYFCSRSCLTVQQAH